MDQITDESVVHIVDDDEMVRDTIRHVLTASGLTPNSNQIRCHASGKDFLQAADANSVGCVILDVHLPDDDGMNVLAKCQSELGLSVIMLTGGANVRMAVQAMQQGAFSFLEKPVSGQLLCQEIQRGVQESANSQSNCQLKQDIQYRFDTLSPREKQVMKSLAAGKHTKRIASELGNSYNTVRVQRASVLKKMRVDTAVDLANLTRRASLFPSTTMR